MLKGPDPQDLFTRHWMGKHSAKDSRWYKSAKYIVPDLVSVFSPSRVLDVGCGACNFANLLMPHVESVTAVDGSAESERHAAPGVGWIHHDLRLPLQVGREFDTVLCLEVAEYLDGEYSRVLVNSLARHTSQYGTVVFCAARIGQGGLGHVNEQPPEYWEHLWESVGFGRTQLDLENALRVSWRDKRVNKCYWRNVMVMTR
jgi:SAM-dependent methyltransferase